MTPVSPAANRLRVEEYYADPHVQARIVEASGGSDGRPPTAAYVAVLGRSRATLPSWENVPRVPADRIHTLWQESADLARSLWDAEHLLLTIELDYQNADAPAEAFLHPADVFVKLEPALGATISVFRSLGVPMPAIATGRGYHFTGQIPLGEPVVDAIGAIVPRTPAWFHGVNARRPPGVMAPMSERQARAAAGLGCLIEFAAHLILDAASGSAVPVVFNGTPVGRTSAVGRESVSIDFSHQGDPLDVRHVRLPFSTYQWHRFRPDIFGQHAASMIPPLAIVPRGRQTLLALVTEGRHLAAASRTASRSHISVPRVTRGAGRLLAAYRSSDMSGIHERFYAELSGDVIGPRLDSGTLPPCVAASLGRPNDLLLKPGHVQHLVRGLMSRDWAPAAIARLVQSVYEADHHWGDRWTTHMHPATRAEFDVRVFSTLIATRRDALVDFNCVSAQEKGLCPGGHCRHDLRADRDHLAALAT